MRYKVYWDKVDKKLLLLEGRVVEGFGVCCEHPANRHDRTPDTPWVKRLQRENGWYPTPQEACSDFLAMSDRRWLERIATCKDKSKRFQLERYRRENLERTTKELECLLTPVAESV
jgi:hypothetical protein